MKIEKYALLDTDFISKTHFIHGDTEKCLVDLVVEMPGYCFFCHSQIIKELSRHNQQALSTSVRKMEYQIPLNPDWKDVAQIVEKWLLSMKKHTVV